MDKIKVAVVDDSGFMRLMISNIINADSGLEVLETGKNGLEAVKLVKKTSPDVLVLDMIMDEYDGKYAIRRIMSENPLPIIVVSGIDEGDSNEIGEIMGLGAYDFVSKPGREKSGIRDLEGVLPARIRSAIRGFQKSRSLKEYVNIHPHTFSDNLFYDAIVIGASTGGPSTVEKLLMQLPSNLPIPVIVAQHMPANFLPSFAGRLNKVCPLPVELGRDGMNIEPGTVYVLSGEENYHLKKRRQQVYISKTEQAYKAFNNPSVDALFTTGAEVYKSRLISIVLTGMGRDGKEGVMAVKKHGGRTIAQDENTSVVYGMPREAAETGMVDHVLPINDMGGFAVSCLS